MQLLLAGAAAAAVEHAACQLRGMLRAKAAAAAAAAAAVAAAAAAADASAAAADAAAAAAAQVCALRGARRAHALLQAGAPPRYACAYGSHARARQQQPRRNEAAPSSRWPQLDRLAQ